MFQIEFVKTFDIPDAWYQCLRRIIEKGVYYTIDKGSFKGHRRKGLDYVIIEITKPSNRPIIPDCPPDSNLPPPTSMEYVNRYMEKLITPFKTPGESYTYGERLTGMNLKHINIKDLFQDDLLKGKKLTGIINQVEEVIRMYKEEGYGTNQACMEVAMPYDIIIKDPPCLRLIDTRIRYGKLYFITYFRSWDLWAGLPTNLAGIQLLKEYMAKQIGVQDGELIASSKGLHLYDYQIELAEKRL